MVFFWVGPAPALGFTPPIRLKLGWKRPPVTDSMRSSTRSRSRNANMRGVAAPSSSGNEARNIKCDEMRAISVRIRRTYWARSGTSSSMSRSAATMNGISLAKPDTQSMRLISAVICG